MVLQKLISGESIYLRNSKLRLIFTDTVRKINLKNVMFYFGS